MMEDGSDIVKEVQSFIDNMDKEQELMKDVLKLSETYLNELAQQKQNVKADINALLELESEELKKVSNKNQVFSVDKEVEQLEAEMRNTKKHNTAVHEQIERSRSDCSKHREQHESLVKEEEAVKKAKTTTLPALRHQVNLYNTMTHIKWQHDCEPHEIKGFVCNKKNVRPFSLNMKQNSQFFIANYLWDMMDEERW